MLCRPPVSTPTDTLFPTRRSSDRFGPDQGLVFANLPFRRLFEVEADDVAEGQSLARLLDAWRERGRTPEVRNYPEWRQAHVDWFALPQASEEEWLLRDGTHLRVVARSEEHTSELQSLMRISYAVFCLKKKKN